MSVRNGLLAVLSQGACYGFQLKNELERRTGGARDVNVGQVYSTLERLERDGLVARSDADPDGRAFFAITPAGRLAVAEWLETPARTPDTAELSRKFALALTLVGVDVRRMLALQRTATGLALRDAESAPERSVDPGDAERLAAAVIADARLALLEAERDWLDRLADRLASLPEGTAPAPVPISGDVPRRGRPPKARSSAA